jgi:hypothetical protein
MKTVNRSSKWIKKSLLSYRAIVILIAIIAAGLTACDSDDDDDDLLHGENGKYFIKVKVDGELMEIKNQQTIDGVVGFAGIHYVAVIEGTEPGNSSIALLLYDDEPIKTGIYEGLEISETSYSGVIIGYGFEEESYTTNPESPEGKVTITVLNNKEIKGTFSGVVVDFQGSERILTEGEFYVPRIELNISQGVNMLKIK